MAKFDKKVILVNEYGNDVCELVRTEHGFYEIPEHERILMDVGDTYKVVEVESEVG